MKKNKRAARKFVWLPTTEQEFLLKAGLFEDSSAITAWQNWKTRCRINDVGAAETRLFPLVYHNLQKLNYSDELSDLLKQSHRTAYKNAQLHLQTARKISRIFEDNGIRSLLLKGAPLGVAYYDSIALRPMTDLDLLIKPDDFFKAAEILKEQNWNTAEKNLPLIIEILQACQFRKAEGSELDLHWRLMRDCWNADRTDNFWESAVQIKYKDILTAETLSATDHLFHVCVHGARYNPVSPIRWIADALMILRSPAADIDWQRLFETGKTYRLNITLWQALDYLKETFNAPISQEYLAKAKALPATRLEEMSFRFFSEPPKAWTLGRFMKEAAFQYSAQISSTRLRPRSLVFIKYLQYFLKTEKISKKLTVSKV